MGRGKAVTPEKERQIVSMLSHGMTSSEIAKILGLGESTVRRHSEVHSRVKPSSNLSDEEQLRIAELHINGKKQCEICKMTGASDKSVARVTRLVDSVKPIINREAEIERTIAFIQSEGISDIPEFCRLVVEHCEADAQTTLEDYSKAVQADE